MRSRVRSRQKVWIVTVMESLDGIDTVQGFSKPELRREVVTETNSGPNQLAAGFDEVYDRYIITYDKSFVYREGMQAFIDVKPVLELDGSLAADSPRPDYIVKRVHTTQKGLAVRVGLDRMGANNAT